MIVVVIFKYRSVSDIVFLRLTSGDSGDEGDGGASLFLPRRCDNICGRRARDNEESPCSTVYCTVGFFGNNGFFPPLKTLHFGVRFGFEITFCYTRVASVRVSRCAMFSSSATSTLSQSWPRNLVRPDFPTLVTGSCWLRCRVAAGVFPHTRSPSCRRCPRAVKFFLRRVAIVFVRVHGRAACRRALWTVVIHASPGVSAPMFRARVH